MDEGSKIKVDESGIGVGLEDGSGQLWTFKGSRKEEQSKQKWDLDEFLEVVTNPHLFFEGFRKIGKN